MASSVSAARLTLKPMLCNSTTTSQVAQKNSLKVGSFGWPNNGFQSLKASRFRFICAAKPETVEKVCEIVRKQLALPADKEVTSGSKFSDLGADSLDTVEIVMGLEEEFDISVEEENSQNIATVQDAADLIDQLVQKKVAPPPPPAP